MAKRAISINEAAETLGIGVSKAYEAANSGELPTIRIGKRILVPLVALEKMLAKVKSEPANDND